MGKLSLSVRRRGGRRAKNAFGEGVEALGSCCARGRESARLYGYWNVYERVSRAKMSVLMLVVRSGKEARSSSVLQV